MKNDIEEAFASTTKLSLPLLQKLKEKGFRYVQVMGFTTDRRLDYMEPRFLLLVPIRELSDDPEKKEIYEPIDSRILEDWANAPDDGIKILIAASK